MNRLKHIIMSNQAWVKEKTEKNPNFFSQMRSGQQPTVLWIGCSDSRVPAEDITGSQPGELFVHRNVANIFTPQDESAMSVLEYAVAVLKVKIIVMCGHTGCGGLQAAITGCSIPHTEVWLQTARKTRDFYQAKLDEFESLENKVKALARYNVMSGAKRIAQTEIVKQAWKEGDSPLVTGWVYDTFSGILEQVVQIDSVMGASIENLLNPEDITVARN